MGEMRPVGKPKFREDGVSPVNSFVKKLLFYGVMAVFLGAWDSVSAAPQHGLAMHGEPELSRDFTHLPYVNPDAPKGGAIRFGEVGTFDSLNPYVLKGVAPWRLRFLTHESLLG